MLRYTTFGAKFIAFISLFFAGIALYLPFLEGFALTPLIAFVHRFSITLSLGDATKTLQPIVFIIPILLIKGLFEYHKRYNLKTLFSSVIAKIVFVLVATDLVSILTTTSKETSIAGMIVHFINVSLFITTTIWLKIIIDTINKDNMRKVGLKIATTFIIAISVFSFLNAFVSVSQFIDCSFAETCHVWKTIDEVFPNKLLLVGHQKFSYYPTVIRSPGFFGDVNFNGMISLLIVLITGTVFLVLELLKKEKGYAPQKEQKLLFIVMVANLISYSLTLSRSALLGFGLTGIVLFILIIAPLIKQFGLPRPTVKRLTLGTLSAIAAVILIFALGFAIPLSYGGRTTSLSNQLLTYVQEMFSPDQKSSQGHADLFKDALIMGNTNPVFGLGIGTFSTQYAKLIDPTNTTSNPHSTYGLLYAEQGIVGLTGYGIIILLLWITAVRSIRRRVTIIINTFANNKRPQREELLVHLIPLFLTLISFGIPYFSLATVSYYGFFLPMTWWWGTVEQD